MVAWQARQSGFGPSRRDRAISAALALAICALLGWALVVMGALGTGPHKDSAELVAVELSGDRASDRQAAAAKAQSAPRERTDTKPVLPIAPPPPPKVTLPSPAKLPDGFITMSSKDYAAADLSRMPRGAAGGGDGQGDSAGAYGPGDGPGGARLFNAEWYREPSHGELAGYLPGGAPAGAWGEIACRTVEHFHVEDCQELAESPRGSGLARALRRAAWQFLVRPPRRDGKALVGAWVRIHFSFSAPRSGEALPGAADGG